MFKCHPFFTGKQKADTGGRVERFKEIGIVDNVE